MNIAEGAGRTGPKERAHFYSIARGSTAECASFLDVILDEKLISQDLYQSLKLHCHTVSKMLYGAIQTNRALSLKRP